jgi:hypothetical protein
MDADEIKEEIAHQRVLQKEYRKRLRVLEQQAAKFGDTYVPPHIQVEIDELAEKVKRCENKVNDHNKLIVMISLEIFIDRFIEGLKSILSSYSNEKLPKTKMKSFFNELTTSIDTRLNRKESIDALKELNDAEVDENWINVIGETMDKTGLSYLSMDLDYFEKDKIEQIVEGLENVLWLIEQQRHELKKLTGGASTPNDNQ